MREYCEDDGDGPDRERIDAWDEFEHKGNQSWVRTRVGLLPIVSREPLPESEGCSCAEDGCDEDADVGCGQESLRGINGGRDGNHSNGGMSLNTLHTTEHWSAGGVLVQLAGRCRLIP